MQELKTNARLRCGWDLKPEQEPVLLWSTIQRLSGGVNSERRELHQHSKIDLVGDDGEHLVHFLGFIGERHGKQREGLGICRREDVTSTGVDVVKGEGVQSPHYPRLFSVAGDSEERCN